MIRTPNQWKAVAWFARENSARPQLSVAPNVTFKMPDGSLVDQNLEVLTIQWLHWREEQSKASRRRK